MAPIVETQRWKLREFGQGDLDELAAMVADEDQMRFYPRPKTRDEASAWIDRNLALYKEYGFGFWFIATAAAMAARDLAFGRFELSRLVAVIHPDHLASRRVAEKIGMRADKTAVLDGYPAVIYAAES